MEAVQLVTVWDLVTTCLEATHPKFGLGFFTGAEGLSTANSSLFYVESTKSGICLFYSHWVVWVLEKTLDDIGRGSKAPYLL